MTVAPPVSLPPWPGEKNHPGRLLKYWRVWRRAIPGVCLAWLLMINVILCQVPGTERTVSQESAQDRFSSPVSVSPSHERRGVPLFSILHLPGHQSCYLHHRHSLDHHQQWQTYQLLEQLRDFPAKVQSKSSGRYFTSNDPLDMFSFLDCIKNLGTKRQENCLLAS